MLIGLDFDNTIAGYDEVFPAVAESEGLIAKGSASSKADVRSILRGQEEGETKWMELQGRVYGAHMHRARLIDGVADFLMLCARSGTPVCIVSHKTKTGHLDLDRINLREAAMTWMESHGFFNQKKFALSRQDVYFESTRAEKVARIKALKCTHFVDDLEEVFLEPGFPESVEQFLLAGNGASPRGEPFKALKDWKSIGECIFQPNV